MSIHSRVRQRVSLLGVLVAALWMGCQGSSHDDAASDSSGEMGPATSSVAEPLLAEVACGQCQFGLAGSGCDLAIRIQGKAYYVDGSSIDDHGDAHAADGLCNAIRTAEVEGRLVGDRFQATRISVRPTPSAKGD